MAEEVVRSSTTEVIPSLKLDGIETALSNLSTMDIQLDSIEARIRQKEVKTRDDCEEMKTLIAELKPFEKTAEAILSPYKLVVKRVKDFLDQKGQRIINRKRVLHDQANQKVSKWEQEEERRTREEQRREQERIDKENREKAEAQRKLDEAAAKAKREEAIAKIREDLKAKKITKRQAEKLLLAAGATEEAEKAKAAADAEERAAKPPEVKVESNKPKVAGTISRRNYYASCVDRRAFIARFVELYNSRKLTEVIRATDHNGNVTETEVNWLDYIDVNDQALGKTAREVKNSEAMQKAFPGVKATDERTY